MSTHAKKTSNPKTQAVATVDSELQQANDATFQIADNRQEIVVQRKLQDIANTYSSQKDQPIQRIYKEDTEVKIDKILGHTGPDNNPPKDMQPGTYPITDAGTKSSNQLWRITLAGKSCWIKIAFRGPAKSEWSGLQMMHQNNILIPSTLLVHEERDPDDKKNADVDDSYFKYIIMEDLEGLEHGKIVGLDSLFNTKTVQETKDIAYHMGNIQMIDILIGNTDRFPIDPEADLSGFHNVFVSGTTAVGLDTEAVAFNGQNNLNKREGHLKSIFENVDSHAEKMAKRAFIDLDEERRQAFIEGFADGLYFSIKDYFPDDNSSEEY